MDLNSSLSSNTINVVSTLTKPTEDAKSSPTSSSSSSSSELHKPISYWPGVYHSPVTDALWNERASINERLFDIPDDAPPPTELLTRTPSESRTTIVYAFSSDSTLREQYKDPWNEFRIGKLLEDLDVLACAVSFKHCSDDDITTRPLMLVTASVDRIVLKKPISVDKDLKISGSIIWVGRSSIEIQMQVITQGNGPDDSDSVALTAKFIFVARDYKTSKAAQVNRLTPETEQEKFLFDGAEARDKARMKRGEDKKQSDKSEVNRLEASLSEGRIFCDMPALADRDSILLRDTRLENALICHPQQRNLHGRIFGGFLMHRAYELAFSTAYAFAGIVPSFLEVDHVDFYKPVDVGDFLRFKSCVLYTEHDNPDQPLIYVEVVAHVTRPEMRSSVVSNTFYFTFTVRPEAKATKNGFRLRNVVPATEEEARRVLERMDAEDLQRSQSI
ncbi:hypothetical protein SO802_022846 [Lithocarpus litseifolius]|uniref:HotDog ACOT-type domain-containing protein n=1 Tax=Lithocarpus litseifolius TaxID=425828 RepID=A0AAW2C5C2_9ROSI